MPKECTLYYHNLSGYTPVAILSKVKEEFHNTKPDVFLFWPKLCERGWTAIRKLYCSCKVLITMSRAH